MVAKLGELLGGWGRHALAILQRSLGRVGVGHMVYISGLTNLLLEFSEHIFFNARYFADLGNPRYFSLDDKHARTELLLTGELLKDLNFARVTSQVLESCKWTADDAMHIRIILNGSIMMP
uniref:Uncharacterized protein n=1 Tax=Oryza meridionalis TaxID=40149 RepID=A0A0E0C3E4_9ORYZ